MTTDHLSYSAISTYQACPMSYRFKYVDKAPTWATPELAFGTAFHETIQGHLQGKGDLLTLWPGAWDKAAKDETRSPILWGMDTPESFHNEGIRMLSHSAITDGDRQDYCSV